MERNELLKKLEPYKNYVDTVWFRFYPVYRFYHKKVKKSIYKALCSLDGYERAVIHARDEPMGAILMELKREGIINNPILTEFRASGTIEMPYYLTHASIKRKILSWFMNDYFKHTDNVMFDQSPLKGVAVTSISPTINAYFKEKYPTTWMPFYWNPNVAGDVFIFSAEKRQEVRRKLGFADNDVIVICSTGGNGRWQQDYMAIPYLLKAGFKVINLTKHQVNIPGVVTMIVPFNEMPAMLSAADAAILWRERTMLNQSASPSKFSEFAAMGLCVIHNKSVDVAAEYIKETGNGFLVDEMTEINAELCNQVKLKMKDREMIATVGREFFGIEKVASTYISAYKDVESSNN